MKGAVTPKPQYAWAKVRVGEVLRLINGRAFKPIEWSNTGLPIVRIQNLNDPGAAFNYYEGELPEKFLLNNGDLLFAWSGTPGTSFGAHIWRGGKAWLNQHIFKVLFDDAVFNKRFLRLAINRNLSEYIQAAHGGAGLAHITKRKFEQSELIKPELDEQCRIVAEIEKQFSRLDQAVASLKRVKANLKRYKAAVLKAAIEGKLTEDWRKQHPDVEHASKLLERILAERRAKRNGKGKYKEPARPDTTDLPSLPEKWTWATVEQLASGSPRAIQSGPFGSHLLHSEFVGDGILAIGIDNVLDGKFSLGRQHRITPDKFQGLRKFEARPRDVVITVMATVGRVCVLPEHLEPAIITKHCYRITPAHGAVDSDFLAIAIRADAPTRHHIFGNIRGQTRPGINGPILKASPVPLPPFAEQRCIVTEVERRLSVIEKLEAGVESNLTRAERLRQAIMGKAFASQSLSSD